MKIPLNRNLAPLQRSGIRVFTNLAKATPGCLMMTLGEPDLDTPQSIKDAACAAINANRSHYAANQGTEELRIAIAGYETGRGNQTNPAQVLVTTAATHALYTALTGILNPGEEVVILTPAFSLYETITIAAGGRPVALDVTKTGFQVTKESLAAVLSEKTKAIVINSPCNPTGTVLNAESMAVIKEAVLGKPIFLVCDNVYAGLSYVTSPDLSLDPELKDQVLLCQSFSKPWAMTGWRVGYLVCPEYVMDRLLLLSAAEIAAVPTFLQDAAVTALKTDTTPAREIYRRRRAYVCSRLREMGLTFPEPEGAFYVFVDISKFGMDSAEFCTRMIREAGLAAVPGSCFGTEGYIRLSYCCSDEILAEGMNRMQKFIKTL